MPVELVALAVYVTLPAPWHLLEVAPITNIGLPTVGVTVTLLIYCAEGPLHPLAVTWILTDPEKPLDQAIIPVAAPIAPAAGLLIDQL